jgi:hypothetical protein
LSRATIYSNFSPGIDEIEQLAQKQQLGILRSGRYNRELGNLILEDGQKIELLTRVMVRSMFTEVLSGKLERHLLERWKHVFFEIVYPTPPQDMKA